MNRGLPFYVESVDDSNDACVVLMSGGRSLALQLSGDCCSQSYFPPESLADLRGLVGETIVSLEQVDSTRTDTGGGRNDSTDWFCLKITTDKQSVSVDWRNDSNGYYSGWLDIIVTDPAVRR